MRRKAESVFPLTPFIMDNNHGAREFCFARIGSLSSGRGFGVHPGCFNSRSTCIRIFPREVGRVLSGGASTGVFYMFSVSAIVGHSLRSGRGIFIRSLGSRVRGNDIMVYSDVPSFRF